MLKDWQNKLVHNYVSLQLRISIIVDIFQNFEIFFEMNLETIFESDLGWWWRVGTNLPTSAALGYP